MDRQEASGALASGGTFRATPTLLEILTPTGEVAATFDSRYFDSVTRNGQTLSITRIGNSSINVTAASLAEAEALDQVLQIGVAAPTPQPAPVADPAAVPPADNDGLNSLLKWGCIGTLIVVGLMALCLIAGLLLFRDSDDESSGAGLVYESVFVINPPPSLEFVMYPGGEASGWITLQISEGDRNLRLVYEPRLSFTGSDRNFALE